MCQFQCKIIQAPFSHKFLLQKKHVAVLLNLIIIKGILYAVANTFYFRPGTFYAQSVVEGKLFVDHAERMVSPHVKKAI